MAELTQNVSEPASRIKEKREISLFSKKENGIHIYSMQRERERERTSSSGFDNCTCSSASTTISLAFSAFKDT